VGTRPASPDGPRACLRAFDEGILDPDCAVDRQVAADRISRGPRISIEARDEVALVDPGGRGRRADTASAENTPEAEAFLARPRGLARQKCAIALPEVDRHDGAAAFCLEKA